MAKRFTDTEKWEDPWFRNLLKEYQMFWIYLLDKCDAAGVWKVDFELAEFCLKQKINPDEYANVFRERVMLFDNGERWFIPKFIQFQYGKLSPQCSPHTQVFKLLEKYNIKPDSVQQNKEFFYKGYLPEENKKLVMERDKNVCCYCGFGFKLKDLVADHVIPLISGGSNNVDNLVASCIHCNAIKSDFPLSEFCSRNNLNFDIIKKRVSERVSSTLKDKDKTKTILDKDKNRVHFEGCVCPRCRK